MHQLPKIGARILRHWDNKALELDWRRYDKVCSSVVALDPLRYKT